MNLPEYLTPNDVAAALKVSRRTVYEWLLTGKLAAYRPAGRYRVSREQLDAFVTRPYSAPARPPAEKPIALATFQPQPAEKPIALVTFQPQPAENPLSNRKNKLRGSK